MAIDLNAIRKKLNNLQTTTGKQNNLWKPDPGKQTIRIVPYQHNKDNPFILEFGVRQGRSTKMFLEICERNNGSLISIDIDDY